MIDRPDNVNIYILYAEEDEDLKRELEDHLSTLQRIGYIDVWHEGLIPPGSERDEVVAEYLRRAHIILLLISSNFFSPECYNRYEAELRLAYERQRSGEVKIIPVILRHCLWQLDILAQLKPLPRGGHPIRSSHWDTRDVAYQEVVLELSALAAELRKAWAEAPRPPEREREPEPAPRVVHVAAGTVEELIARLLEILSTSVVEEAARSFSAVAHRSLFPNGQLEPGFRKLNFLPARDRAKLYRRPPVILCEQPTGRRHIGSRQDRELGEEVRFTIARTEDLGGLGGQVRVFFPGDGGPPRISGLSL